MQKRGQLVFKSLIVIIASAIVIVAFLQAGKSYGKQEAFYKLAVARDLALTIDLMYGLPGNIEYKYPNDISGYNIKVENNRVIVSESKSSDVTAASHDFAGISSDDFKASAEGKKFVKLSKAGNKITMTGVDE